MLQETTACSVARFLNPCGKDGHVEIKPDEQIDIPHVDIKQREVERHQSDVSH